MRIWSYWENPPGRTCPPIIQLCLESIRMHAAPHEFILVEPHTADAYASELDPRWRRIPQIAQRSDYLRAHLLRDHGGLWIDADTVLLKDASVVLDQLTPGIDIVSAPDRDGRVAVNFLAASAASPSIERWVAEQQRYLEGRDFVVDSWNDVGSTALSRAVDLNACVLLKERLVRPLPWYDAELLLSRLQPTQAWIAPDTVAVAVFSGVWERIAAVEAADLVASDLLLGRVLRLAFGTEAVDAESSALRGALARMEVAMRRTRREVARLRTRVLRLGTSPR